MRRFTVHLKDEAATMALGNAFARVLAPGLVIHLQGDLGSGKTTWTRALLHGAGYEGRVKSPTYTLAETYPIVLGAQALELIHFDLYRMGSAEEFLDAGFREHFNDQTVCVVEWPENAAAVLPTPDIRLSLTVHGQGRDVECEALSEQGTQCIDRLHFAPNL